MRSWIRVRLLRVLGVQRLLDQRVAEREPIDPRRHFHHQPGGHRRFDGGERRRGGVVGDGLEHPEAELPTYDGRDRKRRGCTGVQPADTTQDHLRHGARQVARRRGNEPGRLRLAQHLAEEEGMPVRSPMPRRRRLRPRTAVEVGRDQLRALALAERLKLRVRQRHGPFEVGEQLEQGGLGFVLAIRSEQQQPDAMRAQDVADEKQGRSIRPMEVVEYEQQRTSAGRMAQHRADRLEQPVALRVRLARDQDRRRREIRAQHRDDPTDLGDV
jgi:hypothetical protein